MSGNDDADAMEINELALKNSTTIGLIGTQDTVSKKNPLVIAKTVDFVDLHARD